MDNFVSVCIAYENCTKGPMLYVTLPTTVHYTAIPFP